MVCRLMGLPDPRTQGSGNPGATNVLRHGGKKAALITLCLDTLKGTVAVLIALLIVNSSWVLASVTLAVFLGHLYPLFFNFRGGKGVATAFGGLVVLVWQAGLLALITWLTTAFIFKYSSLAALLAALLTPLYVFYFSHQNEYYTLMSAIMSVLLIWRHRSNIRNLLQGQEDKIGHV